MLGWNKANGTFSTYVLVSDHDPELWFDMSVDPVYMAFRHGRSSADAHIELWVYNRNEQGDTLKEKKKLCPTCWMYGRPGQMMNANQWVNCPKCGNKKSTQEDK